MTDDPTLDAAHFRALFEPRGVVVAGASSHPGKFGFVALHNILSQGYRGEVYATNRDGGTILGIDTVASIDELPGRRRRRSRLRLHAGRRQPRPAPRVRTARDPGGVHHQRRLRRSGGGGAASPKAS